MSKKEKKGESQQNFKALFPILHIFIDRKLMGLYLASTRR